MSDGQRDRVDRRSEVSLCPDWSSEVGRLRL